LDENLTRPEQAEVFKQLISNFILKPKDEGPGAEESAPPDGPAGFFKDAAGVAMLHGDKLYRIDDGLVDRPKLFQLAGERARRLQAMKEEPFSRAKKGAGKPPAGVNEEYYYRSVPYERILAMGSRLFFAAEGFPALKVSDKASGADGGTSSDSADKLPLGREGGPRFIVIFLRSAEADAGIRTPYRRIPLDLTEENISRILDSLMELDEDEQVQTFDRDYLRKYDPDDPVLAKLTGEFIYKNLGTVFILGDDLSTGFDFLEQLYYRKRSMNRFLSAWRRSPRSLTGEEILFYLAAFLDFERRTVMRLKDAQDLAQSVLSGGVRGLRVFDDKAKAYVCREVYRDFTAKILRNGYMTQDAVIEKYRREEIGVYEKLTAVEGMTRNRALFNLGCFYWDEKKSDLAIRAWEGIDPSFSTGRLARIRKMMARMKSGTGTKEQASSIDAVLQEGDGSNRQELLNRMTKFHRWAKRSAAADKDS
jgi:hypothetical protein